MATTSGLHNIRPSSKSLTAINLGTRKTSLRLNYSNPILVSLWMFLLMSSIHCHQDTAQSNRVYTNQFAIHVEPGKDADSIADEVAKRYGFENHGQIGSLDGHYLLVHHNVAKRSADYAHSHHLSLKDHPKVLWVEQQHVKHRVKRDNPGSDFRYESAMSDPLYNEQWYLNHGARGGFDMNVAGAWALGYTGKGVVVTILDDGIQPNHPDLIANYDPRASFDINDNDPDPTPQDNGDNKHGTRCAGEVAAMAYNEYCGVGIAFNSSIGGVRMLDGTVTDDVEARALSLNPDHVDIYSASWGPEDDGKTVDGPGRLAQRAFANGIQKGRKGLGSLFVWASGNGGRKQDSCNCDGYTNSIYTLSISSATQHGAKPWYLEECSSTLATTYSSGSPGTDQNVVTVDMDMTYFKSLKEGRPPVTSYLCTLSHTGTSASAPIAAAMCALALEANPGLSWRDVQHIVVATSRYEPLRFESGWVTNGVGRKVSHKFGYGLMDAEAMVRLAEKWLPSPQQRICETTGDGVIYDIPADNNQQLEVTLSSNACKDTRSEIRYVEHVQARLSLKFKPRGNLKITLISPSGTPTNLLLPRPKDSDENSFNNWPFLSVHFWGEEASGIWKLVIKNEGSRPSHWPGKLISWSMVFYGTYEKPQNFELNKNYTYHYLPRRTYKESVPMNECAKAGKFLDSDGQCVITCPLGYYGEYEKGSCEKCSPECSKCFGPTSDNCLACNDEKFYYGDRCVAHCPDTHYADVKIGECLPCSSNCRACEGSPSNCKTCRPKLFLDDNNHCLSICNGSNVEGYNNCLQCKSPCSTCFDVTEKSCLSCMPGYRLAFTECMHDTCAAGYFQTITRESGPECRACHYSCKTCTGPSHRECQDCNANTTKRDGFCQPCREGLFLNAATKTCESCHPSCAECTGATSDDCTMCGVAPDAPLFLDGSRCVPCCKSNDAEPISPNELTGGNLSESGNCCKCYNHQGPCISQEHTRSIYGGTNNLVFNEEHSEGLPSESWAGLLLRRPNAVIASICIAAVLMFATVFMVLQVISGGTAGGRRNYRDYKKVSSGVSASYDKNFERVSLTADDDEDSLFEKT